MTRGNQRMFKQLLLCLWFLFFSLEVTGHQDAPWEAGAAFKGAQYNHLYTIMEVLVPWSVWTRCQFKLMGPYTCPRDKYFAATKCCESEPYENVFFVCQNLSNIDNFITLNLVFPICSLSLSLCLSPPSLFLPYFAMGRNKLKVSTHWYIRLLYYFMLKYILLGSFSH